MIKIDHISFSYGEENENTGGVRDIDLNIEDGQFVVLCGESGCGKTTVTRLINGLIPHYYEGKMTGEVMREDFTQELIMTYAAKFGEDEQ